MRRQTKIRRRQKALADTVAPVGDGSSYRNAGKLFRVLKSTAIDWRNRAKASTSHCRRFALKVEEEQLIVNLIFRFIERGIPITLQHVREAAGIIINTFS